MPLQAMKPGSQFWPGPLKPAEREERKGMALVDITEGW
jgi:hypothetical protein